MTCTRCPRESTDGYRMCERCRRLSNETTKAWLAAHPGYREAKYVLYYTRRHGHEPGSLAPLRGVGARARLRKIRWIAIFGHLPREARDPDERTSPWLYEYANMADIWIGVPSEPLRLTVLSAITAEAA